MQIKTIRKNIRDKMNDWLSSIDNQDLVKNLKNDIIVTGGCIVSLFFNEKVNDYDVYIRTRSTLMELIKYYTKDLGTDVVILNGEEKQQYLKEYEDKFGYIENEKRSNSYKIAIDNLKEDQIKLFFNSAPGYKADIPENNGKETPEGAPKYRLSYLSPNAISLTDDVQIVIRFWGEPDEIHKNYDFAHATNYFTFSKGLVTNNEALESLLTKQLIYKGSLYPVTSIIRVKKFVARNWKINAGEMLKMMFQVSELDLSNHHVLEEQLIGVDVAYFAQLINAIRTLKVPLDATVLGVLIDRIFNNDEEDEQDS